MKYLAIAISGIPLLVSVSVWAQAPAQKTQLRSILYDKVRPTAQEIGETTGERQIQLICAYKLATLMARRDKFESYATAHAVEIEPSGRIRVFFVFDRNMKLTLPKLGTL